MSIALKVKKSEENEVARGYKRWFKVGYKEIRENQRKVVKAYVACRDVLVVASDIPHCSICSGFLQTWRKRSCTHSLPRYFPFGVTNERSSVDPS